MKTVSLLGRDGILNCLLAVVAAASGPDRSASSALVPRSVDVGHYVNANKVLGFVSNQGILFYDLGNTFGQNPGFYFPYTSVENILNRTDAKTAIFAAGLWLGGQVDGQTHVAIADYGSEFTPGQVIGGTFPDDAYTNPAYRVYKLYADSLATNPNQDYLEWPIGQGAPLDSTGHPLFLGQQTLWAVYNDLDSSRARPSGGTARMGVEVQQLAYATDGSYYQNQAIYIQYKLYNRSGKTIDNFYLSFWMDADLGSPGDDLVGCDTTHDMTFCYNAGPGDGIYGMHVPAVGVRCLYGPIVPSAGDTAWFVGYKLPGYRNTRMSASSRYINGTDPGNSTQVYNYMQGLKADGSPYEYGGQPVRFMCSGDPVNSTGDLDFAPSDKRQMASFGPFTFNPGDSQQVLFKVGVGQGADRLSSINVMKAVLDPDTSYHCPSAEMTITDFGALTKAAFAPTSANWLNGVNWGGATFDGGIGYGKNFLGSALDPATMPDSFANVEIRFSKSERQKAYRYLRPGYDYGFYYPVPFTVWDIDHNRQLNAAFVEWTGSRVFDSTWSVDDSLHYGGREYLIVFRSDYSGLDPYAAPLHYPARNLKNDAGLLDIMYAGWLCLAPGHTMNDLASDQILSIQAQTLMHNGVQQQVLFRDTKSRDTTIQEILLGCQGGFIGDVRLSFAGDLVFSESVKPEGYFLAPEPTIRDVREIANGLGPVDPPDGRNVNGVPNSTGDWTINGSLLTYYGADTLGNVVRDDWEIRFTAEGSECYDNTTNLLFGHVPFEVWSIGNSTPADPADDRRCQFVIWDRNANGVWDWGDRIYALDRLYALPLPENLEPDWSRLLRVGRIQFESVSGFTSAPATGTIVRLVPTKFMPLNRVSPLASEPDFPILPQISRVPFSPEGFDYSCRLQFAPPYGGTFAGVMQVRDAASDNLLTTIQLSGSTPPSCCSGTTGNVNVTGIVDLADLTALVSYLTGGGYILPCPDAANVNGQGVVDLGDLSALVSYLTGGGFVLPNCP